MRKILEQIRSFCFPMKCTQTNNVIKDCMDEEIDTINPCMHAVVKRACQNIRIRIQ